MSLNKKLQIMLAANEGPALQDMSLQDARTALEQSFLLRGYPIEHPATIEHRDISGASGNFSLDIYRPQGSTEKLPVLVYFHGGGFVLGGATACDRQSRALSYLLDVAVVFVNYRLAPEHVFPAAVDDAKETINWLLENAESLNLNLQKLITCGESAGGNLAVHAALAANQLAQQDLAAHKVTGTSILYPVTDLRPFYQPGPEYPSLSRYGSGYNLDIAELKWFWQHYLAEDKQAWHPDNSLLLHPQLALLSNTQIFGAECDPLRDMGIAFASKLQELDVAVSLDCLPGMLHSFMFHGSVCPAALRNFYKVVEQIDQQFHSKD